MATRVVEGKKPYTGGEAIDINQNKVISLKLRDENNLIIYDSGDDEIYVDLQLEDGIEPTDAFPVGVTTGRVLVADEWDKTGTLICAKTTSGDNIKLLYADDGTLWIDNGTGTFKQIYLSTDIATILTDYATKEYVDAHDTIISSTEPEDPYEGMIWYNTTSDKLKVYDGTAWQDIGSGGGGSSYTAGYGIDIDANDEISVDTSEIATQSDLSSKQDELVSGTNIKTINNESLLGTGDITISGGGADIEYKTQAEYDALPSSKLTDGKHYVIYTADTPTPPTPWQPGVDTVLYYDFEHTSGTTEVNQASDSNYNGTYTATPTISTLASGKKYFDGSNTVALYTNNRVSTINYSNATFNVWIKINGQNGSMFGQARWNQGNNPTIFGEIYQNNMQVCLGEASNVMNTTPLTGWMNLVICNDSSSSNLYINGSLAQSTTYVSATKTEDYYLYINAVEAANETPPPRSQMIGSFSFGSLIIENKSRTIREIQDYFDQTKGDYGIS